MAALNVGKLPEGEAWIYEVKWDGYRALAVKDGDSVRLLSRKGNNLTRDYPEIVEAVQGIDAKTAVLDGEIVALDAQGRPSFQMLQHRGSLGKKRRVVYYAFDLLNLNGRDLRGLPLEERKNVLATIVRGSRVLLSANLEGPPAILIEQVARLKLEGIIAKRRTRPVNARASGRS
jgi:bifunctional non-homologous end joining protein LigD